MPKRKHFGVAFALVVIAKGEALKQSMSENLEIRI